MRFPLLAKVGAIALVGVMVMACLARIEGLVGERRARGEEAVRNVEQSHAAAQVAVGPLLQRACTEEWDTVTEKDKDRVVTHEKREFTLTQAPTRLAIDGRTTAEPLYRGLFKVNAYAAKLALDARFATLVPMQAHAQHAGGRLACGAPELFVALSDVRGIRTTTMFADAQALDVHPGTPSAKYAHGFSAPIPAARGGTDDVAQPLDVKVSLGIVGTGQLAWVPAAGDVQWTLNSDWPHPSFGGQFLPDERTIRADGFAATWHLSALATTAFADIGAAHDLCVPAVDSGGDGEAGTGRPLTCLDTMAVSFIDPVNPYVLSDRAVKYALLFVLVTFVAVGLIEVLSGRRVHPVQYLLVGLALSVFFLLLLSLSEHLPFEQAYVAASVACASLLGFYASAMFGRKLAGLAFGLGIALLYGLLYALLQMEQNALAIGSVMLFAGLAAVMALTRRIDWYALFARLRANGAATPSGAGR